MHEIYKKISTINISMKNVPDFHQILKAKFGSEIFEFMLVLPFTLQINYV